MTQIKRDKINRVGESKRSKNSKGDGLIVFDSDVERMEKKQRKVVEKEVGKY